MIVIIYIYQGQDNWGWIRFSKYLAVSLFDSYTTNGTSPFFTAHLTVKRKIKTMLTRKLNGVEIRNLFYLFQEVSK